MFGDGSLIRRFADIVIVIVYLFATAFGATATSRALGRILKTTTET